MILPTDDEKEKRRAYQRNWQRNNSGKTRQYHQTYVSKPGVKEKRSARTRKWTKENPEKVRQRNQDPKGKQARVDNHRKHRTECLEIYSKRRTGSSKPICCCCGLKDERFLQMDHIHGVTSKDGRGGSALIGYLRRNNYPEGYQVLCGNCNKLKHATEKKKLSDKPYNVKKRQQLQDLRKEVLTHYSKGKPKCNCCGFANITVLEIDHIEGRKNVRHSPTYSTRQVYYYLKRNDYPPGYQVLCAMCNTTKRDLHKCPHQEST